MKKLIFVLIVIAAFSIVPNTTHANSDPDFSGTLKAAKQGKAEAQYNLGLMYDNGQGVNKDYTKAVYWFSKAAEQGRADAQYILGLMYYEGQGVNKDYTKAVYWHTKAAEQGYAEAQLILGLMYLNGVGVAKDMVLAYTWLNLAAIYGDEDAVKYRDLAESELDPARRNEGQRLASNWKIGQSIKREK